MLRLVTAVHQQSWSAIEAVIVHSNDGNPAAQLKMLERIKEAAIRSASAPQSKPASEVATFSHL
jgi:hypothetical protein